jgi:hypothetical protein
VWNLGIADVNSVQYYDTVCQRRLKLRYSLVICDSRNLRKYCVHTSINFEVNMLDDFATHCVRDSSGEIGAIFLEIVRWGVQFASGVVVAVTIIAADCQTCNENQSRRCKIFIIQCHILGIRLRTKEDLLQGDPAIRSSLFLYVQTGTANIVLNATTEFRPSQIRRGCLCCKW